MAHRTTGVDTLADLLDRLIVEVSRLSVFENVKREESLKKNPDKGKIFILDRKSRDSCELRSEIKKHINKCVKDIVESGSYNFIEEPRTFKPPANTVADAAEDMCQYHMDNNLASEFAKALDLSFKSE